MNTCGFRASAAKEKLKQDAQTNVADAMQAKFVLNMTQLDVLLRHYSVSLEGSDFRVFSPHDSAEAPATRHAALETKAIMISPVARTLGSFFLNNFIHYLYSQKGKKIPP